MVQLKFQVYVTTALEVAIFSNYQITNKMISISYFAFVI